MVDDVRVTTTVARVLRVFLDEPTQPRYGFELMQLTKMPSGSLYPVLARLEGAGWLKSQREAINPAETGRPARRNYLLTADGAQAARCELASLTAAIQPTSLRGLAPQGGTA